MFEVQRRYDYLTADITTQLLIFRRKQKARIGLIPHYKMLEQSRTHLLGLVKNTYCLF